MSQRSVSARPDSTFNLQIIVAKSEFHSLVKQEDNFAFASDSFRLVLRANKNCRAQRKCN